MHDLSSPYIALPNAENLNISSVLPEISLLIENKEKTFQNI